MKVRAAVLVLMALMGCRRALAPVVTAGESSVALSGGPNTSMTYLAHTSDGVLAIDLGWWGHRRAIQRALHDLHAAPADVRMVFLTHSHVDHVGAWRLVRKAKFFISAPEYARLVSDSAHGAWLPGLAHRMARRALPRKGDLDIHTFSQDTVIIAGSDTVRAYLVAGHTAGSSVYLFRGILFLGDAATYSRRGGFAPARRGYSDDPGLGAELLEKLWQRLPPNSVRYVCTAHARCAPFSDELLRDIIR